MIERLADLLHRRRRAVVIAAVAFSLLAAGFGAPVVGMLSAGDDFDAPSAPSFEARERIADATGRDATPLIVALVRLDGPVTGERAQAQLRSVVDTLRADPGIVEVSSALDGDSTMVSTDGRSSYVAAWLTTEAKRADVAERVDDALGSRDDVVLGGGAIIERQVSKQVQSDLARAEMIAFPILLVLSLVVFRGVIAALLPLLVGGLTIVTTFLAMRLVNEGLELSVFAINLVTGLGLGLAIDYSLFIVSRYREEIARSGPGVEALRRTLATAGRTVLFSALTVAAALASLCVFPFRFLYSMGIGGVLVALTAGGIALVVLPALLALLGTRVDALAPRRWQHRTPAVDQGPWYRLSRLVMRRPGRIALATAALMIVLGLPFSSIRFTGIDPSVLPTGASARVVDEALRSDFGNDRTSPAYVLVDAPRGAASQLDDYAQRLRALDGARAVAPPQAIADSLWRIDVVPREGALAESTKRMVQEIAGAPAPGAVAVGGPTAAFLDRQDILGDHLPIAVALVAVTTFAILFLMTGSVVLPLKALVMNLLTVSAAFGLLVLIFQDGRLEGLLAYTSQGALESTQPVLLFALAFGLSTDYGVFLLGRIKEAHDRGLNTREAVAVGLQRTGRIVTAAALLFCIAVGALATSEMIFIKELGVGTALAVIIDATIVRALLVPSLMALLGRWNWWAPGPLRRLHQRIGISEAPHSAGA